MGIDFNPIPIIRNDTIEQVQEKEEISVKKEVSPKTIEDQLQLIHKIFLQREKLNIELDRAFDDNDHAESVLSDFKEELKNLKNTESSLSRKEILEKQITEAEKKAKELEKQFQSIEHDIEHCTEELKNNEELLCLMVNKDLDEEVIHREDLPIKFSEMSFSEIPSEEKKQQIDYLLNMEKVALENLEKFILEVKERLLENRALILKEFCKSDVGMKESNVEFHTKLLGADSHHGGKTPLLVTLILEGNELGKLVYKPRGAETDKAILEMFKKLNHLEEDKKSGRDLPTYKIIDFEHFSFWEFIEGVQLGSAASTALVGLKMEVEQKIVKIEKEIEKINEKKEESAEKEKKQQLQIEHKILLRKSRYLEMAEVNLERLHSVCLYAGITDLHQENILLSDIKADKYLQNITFLDGGEYQWIPIDLELVEEGHATGLYGGSNEPELRDRLNKEEKAIIDDFSESQKARVSRFLPLPTAIFQNLIVDYTGVDTIPEEVMNVLKKQFEADIFNEIELKELIRESVRKGDIPFFTKKGGYIYYEVSDKKVAKIKSRR